MKKPHIAREKLVAIIDNRRIVWPWKAQYEGQPQHEYRSLEIYVCGICKATTNRLQCSSQKFLSMGPRVEPHCPNRDDPQHKEIRRKMTLYLTSALPQSVKTELLKEIDVLKQSLVKNDVIGDVDLTKNIKFDHVFTADGIVYST